MVEIKVGWTTRENSLRGSKS